MWGLSGQLPSSHASYLVSGITMHHLSCVQALFLFLASTSLCSGGSVARHLKHEVKRDAGDEVSPLGSPVNLVSVVKNVGGTNNTFTLRYTKNAQDLVFEVQDLRFSDGDSFTEAGTESADPSSGEGTFVYTLSIMRSQEYKDAMLRISTRNKMRSIMLEMDNDDEEMTTQTVFRVPQLEISPLSATVYQRGHNIQFTMLTSAGNSTNGERTHRRYQVVYAADLNANSNQLFVLSRGNPLLEVDSTRNEVTGDERAEVTINTSERPLSGIFEVYLSRRNFDSDPDGIIEKITVTSAVVIRPTDLAGPFPQGYVGFVGTNMVHCSLDEPCPVSCGAAGNSLSSISVTEEMTGGALVEVPSATQAPSLYPKTIKVLWTVTARESDTALSIRRFRCEAVDATHGTSATMTTEVTMVLRASIDRARSNVTVEVDPSNPSLTRYTLNCAVIGQPLPEVTFNYYHWYRSEYVQAPDTVTPEGQGAVATKVVTAETRRSPGYNTGSLGPLLGAACSIIGRYLYEYDRYEFNVPSGSSPSL